MRLWDTAWTASGGRLPTAVSQGMQMTASKLTFVLDAKLPYVQNIFRPDPHPMRRGTDRGQRDAWASSRKPRSVAVIGRLTGYIEA
jgi:hypothetical protein